MKDRIVTTEQWRAWDSTGTPWWDRCTCGHYRWAHVPSKCDRLAGNGESGKACRCKSFMAEQSALEPA